jgi:hypothetical protein
MRRLLAPLTAIALLTAACGTQDSSSPVSLDDGADAVDVTEDHTASDDTTTDDTANVDTGSDTGDAGSDDADSSAEVEGQPFTSGDAFDAWSDHPLSAAPGRWAVGDAGYVEFDLTEQGLVLVEVSEADGWRSQVDDDSSDEIEVEFQRDNTTHEIEIEWDGRNLEIDINTDIEPAADGLYDLGPAGSFEFTGHGSLQLVDVVVADGWELRMDDETSDEIEFTLANGNERWHVEIELDDGQVELEIDYRVRTTIDR